MLVQSEVNLIGSRLGLWTLSNTLWFPHVRVIMRLKQHLLSICGLSMLRRRLT